MAKILQSGWMTAITGGVLYLLVTTYLLSPDRVFKGVNLAAGGDEVLHGPSWEFSNVELDRLITELRKEKEAVTLREQQLNELATRLQAERAEINQVTQTVFRLQQEFDQNVLHIREQESANLKRLAKLYSAMAPDAAATVLKQMDDEQIAKVLVFMKEGEAAPLLEGMARGGEAEAKRAAAIVDRLRKSVRSPEAGQK